MSDLQRARLAKDDGDDVEAIGAVVDLVCPKKESGGSQGLGFLGEGDNGLGGGEVFAGPGFYLDKNDSAVGIDHNEVELAHFAGEVAGEGLKAFSLEEGFAAFFPPSAEARPVG